MYTSPLKGCYGISAKSRTVYMYIVHVCEWCAFNKTDTSRQLSEWEAVMHSHAQLVRQSSDNPSLLVHVGGEIMAFHLVSKVWGSAFVIKGTSNLRTIQTLASMIQYLHVQVLSRGSLLSGVR